MTITIQSIQVGRLVSEGDPGSKDLLERHWTTGFYKTPVQGPIKMTRLGLVGDAVADTKHHGGPDKAVLCYAASHYELWAAEHPQLRMTAGALAENLTLTGVDESRVCIGDRFRVADCEIEVSQPRQPCWKIARRWGVKTLTKEVTVSGRTGWYVRVVQEGTIDVGQPLELLDRPNPEWSVARANNVLFGRESDRLAVIELMSVKELAEAWRESIA